MIQDMLDERAKAEQTAFTAAYLALDKLETDFQRIFDADTHVSGDMPSAAHTAPFMAQLNLELGDPLASHSAINATDVSTRIDGTSTPNALKTPTRRSEINKTLAPQRRPVSTA